jgi:hypothetical protein
LWTVQHPTAAAAIQHGAGALAARPGHGSCPSLAWQLQSWTRMKLAHLSLSFVMSALVPLPVGRASADDSRCFEFASPTAEQVFRASSARRLLIGMPASLSVSTSAWHLSRAGIDTRRARGSALSGDAAKRLTQTQSYAWAVLAQWRPVGAMRCPSRLIGVASLLAQPGHATTIEGRALARIGGGCYPDARRQAVVVS